MDRVIFTDYIVVKKKGRIFVRGTLTYTNLERSGAVFSYWVVPFLTLFIPLPFDKLTPLVAFIKLLIIIITFLLVKPYVDRLLTKSFLEIDKKRKIFESKIDNFKTDLSQIKEIEITEESNEDQDGEYMLYLLKFHLQNGEKTSAFAFTTYNKLEQLLKIIK